MFKKQPIHCLNDNIVERLKFSSIKLLFDNWIYVSNPQNPIIMNYLFMVIKG